MDINLRLSEVTSTIEIRPFNCDGELQYYICIPDYGVCLFRDIADSPAQALEYLTEIFPNLMSWSLANEDEIILKKIKTIDELPDYNGVIDV